MDDSYYNLLDEQLFNEALSFAEKIFPYQKSVTGEGIDHAFEDLGNEIDCNIYEFKTGSKILDWEVPHSWKCESFSIKNLDTNEIIASLDSPLRVASHSDAFCGEILGKELKKNVLTSSKVPNSISHGYIYYSEGWAVSLTKDELSKIYDDTKYLVEINSETYNGSLKVAEHIHNGSSKFEMFFLSHLCHPAQFNDGLVGVLVNVYLAKWLKKYSKTNFYNYKFLFLPETIGSHAYCSIKDNFKNGVMSIFTEMLALDAPLHIQMSENEDDLVNLYLKLAAKTNSYRARFSPYLSVIRNDEKVFGAPGIDIPSASVTRALGREYQNHPYMNYHTSEDNIANSDLESLKKAICFLQVFISIIEKDVIVERQFDGLPMLSKHDLFFSPKTHRDLYDLQEKIVWQLRKPKLISEIARDLNANFFDILILLTSWKEKNLVKFMNLSWEKRNESDVPY
tara:strand:- start:7240 stop:8598 length:1359 start_codon:yes stop_codon:yes gene_type:complete